uniref:glycosyltransferase family 2 protein n=2 Tax=Paracoccus TaxID=265 RepID=UPI00262D110C
SSIPGRINRKLKQRAAERHVRSSLQVLHGSAMTRLADDQVALIIVGRDVSYFLEHHIRYHLARGVSHVVYVDNGSTDNSIEIAKRFPDMTIARCAADFRLHEGRIRYLANTRFLSGGWRLAIDPDELLDYPGSNRIDLPELARRMRARGHSAMVAQMLDMVPDGPVSAAAGIDFAQAERIFDRFSLTEITKAPYHGSGLQLAWFLDQNRISNSNIAILFGGLRHAAFGENCCLTKHALFRMEKGVVPQPHPHVTTGVSCTDFSAVLRHYKFAGDMLAREKKLLAENRVAHGETQLRVARMEREGDMNLGTYAECQGFTVEGLVDRGFLKISDAAMKMLA